MAIENHLTGLFDTLALPPLQESYRQVVIDQLYQNIRIATFQSVCWASKESPARGLSKLVVLPGEERYMAERLGLETTFTQPYAHHCVFGRTESNPRTGEDDEGEPVVEIVDTRFCTIPPETRPLMCRIFPFGIQRIEGDKRSFNIIVEKSGMRFVQRKWGDVFINQMLHNVAQLGMSMWAFLDDKWWAYYESAFSDRWEFEALVTAKFELTDDAIFSQIRGAPPEMRREVLIQIAKPECELCSGEGWAFVDRTPDKKTLLPPTMRRFDLCPDCVQPVLGLRVGNILRDPRNGKILDASGREYRGD